MAYGKKKHGGKGAGDGSNVPSESCELDGNIITAAQSTMEAKSYAEGYPLPPDALHMRQGSIPGKALK